MIYRDFEKYGVPYFSPTYCEDMTVLQRLWAPVPEITNVSELRSHALTSEIPGLHTIVQAIDFFEEPRTHRDIVKNVDHKRIGYSPRLKPTDRFEELARHIAEDGRHIFFGLKYFIQERVPPITREIRKASEFGVKDFRELAYDQIGLLQAYWTSYRRAST